MGSVTLLSRSRKSCEEEIQIAISRSPFSGICHQLHCALRGVVVSYETIRRWCDQLFGAIFAPSVTVAGRKLGTTWHLDEVFVTPRGEPYLLWRAVDQHRSELNILLQKRRDTAAAKRFFKRVLASCHDVPRKIVTNQ